MTTYASSIIENQLLEFFEVNPFDEPNYNPTYLGEKHYGISTEFYDINISKSAFIKLYHSNRNIDKTRVNSMYQKFKVKAVDFPPLIVAHIVDDEYDKNEYVLIDGQHRYYTMKELYFNDKKDNMFSYKLYRCKSVAELEDLFTDINCNIKFDNMFPYKNLGKLIDKLEAYFKMSVSNSKHPHSHKFNPKQLKEKLSAEKFFEIYDNSVDDVFKKIIILNDKIREEYYNKKLLKKLLKCDILILDRIDSNKKNPMYLLMKEEFKWIDDLKLMLKS